MTDQEMATVREGLRDTLGVVSKINEQASRLTDEVAAIQMVMLSVVDQHPNAEAVRTQIREMIAYVRTIKDVNSDHLVATLQSFTGDQQDAREGEPEE